MWSKLTPLTISSEYKYQRIWEIWRLPFGPAGWAQWWGREVSSPFVSDPSYNGSGPHIWGRFASFSPRFIASLHMRTRIAQEEGQEKGVEVKRRLSSPRTFQTMFLMPTSKEPRQSFGTRHVSDVCPVELDGFVSGTFEKQKQQPHTLKFQSDRSQTLSFIHFSFSPHISSASELQNQVRAQKAWDVLSFSGEQNCVASHTWSSTLPCSVK